MQSRYKIRLILASLLLLAIVSTGYVLAFNIFKSGTLPFIDSAVVEALETQQEISVSITLKGGENVTSDFTPDMSKEERLSITKKRWKDLCKIQANVLAGLEESDFKVKYKYPSGDFAGDITKSGLEKLRNNEHIRNIYANRKFTFSNHSKDVKEEPSVEEDPQKFVWALQTNSQLWEIDKAYDFDNKKLCNDSIAGDVYLLKKIGCEGLCFPENLQIKLVKVKAIALYGAGTNILIDCRGVAYPTQISSILLTEGEDISFDEILPNTTICVKTKEGNYAKMIFPKTATSFDWTYYEKEKSISIFQKVIILS